MYFLFLKRHLEVLLLILIIFTKFVDMLHDIDPRCYHHKTPDVITRDVCIIGGGSSGTYSAIQLQKVRKSFVVVEKENVMGGHTNTYTDPKTKQTIDYGVVIFQNFPEVIDYFNYLKIQWMNQIIAVNNSTDKTIFFDFSTYNIVNNVTVPNPESGLQAYATHLINYGFLEEGFFLPDPIPNDLLLPFGEFLAKYKNISDAVGIIFLYCQGLVDFLQYPTLYVFKNFGTNVIKDITNGFIVTEDNSNIYSRAYDMLRDNVLLQSSLIRVNRSASNGVEVIVQTHSGRKIIKAKKLLVTIPPMLDNLVGFDLRTEEMSLFSQFMNSGYYTGLVGNTGLPANLNINNMSPERPWALPILPGLYAVRSTSVEEVYDIKYASNHSLSDKNVKDHIIASLVKLQEIGIAKKTNRKPTFKAYNNHSPFELRVSVEAIRKGFYKKLYGLQGKYNTYWTGAAFHIQNSGSLWKFTKDHVLPVLMNSL